MKFIYTETTTVDDIIEHILARLNQDYAGGCLQVPDFCNKENSDSPDYNMELRVRQTMYDNGIARRCTGSNQPETAIELTAKGITVYQAGGWKKYLVEHNREKATQKGRSILEERRKSEAHQAALSSAQATVEAAKYAKSSSRAAWLAGILAVVSLLTSIFQYVDSRSTNVEIDLLKMQLQKIRQQLQSSNFQKLQVTKDTLRATQIKYK